MNWDTLIDPGHAQAIIEGRSGDPFALLGPHEASGQWVVRVFVPGAEGVELLEAGQSRAMTPYRDGLFVLTRIAQGAYTLRIHWPSGEAEEVADPYAFGPVLGDLDLHLFGEGRHWQLGRCMGAQPGEMNGISGTSFSVWAPNARRVSVIGDFNGWDGRRHPMRQRNGGVWEIFLPGVAPGAVYKYEIVGPTGEAHQKADPMARLAEKPPATGSVVAQSPDYEWSDAEWMGERAARQSVEAPMAIYEVHAASWLRTEDGTPADWAHLERTLVPYVARMGFTHIEMLPIMEHPFGGSWGYQPLGQFAPTSLMGRPEDFARFVDTCHREGIGVILDWVPAHFPTDPHGLAQFDGTHLYEHADPREGFHQDWNTLIYNLGRREVSGFLIASALWWLETFHVDGLRVDAVASMLYRDYSRAHDQWIPNKYGGRENLESVDFLKHLTQVVNARAPGAVTLAEESTAWPGVSAPVSSGGLGFSYKWNMGWMHDTLGYMERDPLYRSWHHHDMTFGMVYAFSENFVLPLSHDEVVHGKGSLFGKMPGDRWQKLANLRAYLSFMWSHPGKKLLFMGGEIAQPSEWNHDAQIDWGLLDDPDHAGMQSLVRDLNRHYADSPALHRRDCEPGGFEWLVADDPDNSVYGFVRYGADRDRPVVVLCNFTPTAQTDYRVGLPREGRWREMFNSDAAIYGGSNLGNGGAVETEPQPWHGHPRSARLVLPPLATLFLIPEG